MKIPSATRTICTQHVTAPVAETPAPQEAAPWSRRNLLAAGAVGAGTLVLGASRASATTPPPSAIAPQQDTAPLPPAGVDATVKVLPPIDRHVIDRCSWGINEALAAEVTAAGGASKWIDAQLDYESIPDPIGDDINGWWPYLFWSPQKLWDQDQTGGMQGFEVQADFERWTMLRRMYSSRQLHEIMADFWSNLFHVPAPLSKSFPHRMFFDTTIRANSLKSFRELLRAADLHPAMLCYLDNAKSTNSEPNENLGRELLELHTLGDTNYSEADVKNSMYILTGWLVDMGATWEARYSETDHWVGPVQVLGFKSPNTDKDGRQVAYDYLDYLARHPRVATAIARQLAIRFVGDAPSQSVIDAVAAAYTASDTDIKTTLRALFSHPDFLNGLQRKVRTPIEDMINTYRSMQIGIKKPTGSIDDAAKVILFECAGMGQRPFDWPRPDGFPDRDDAWSSAGRMLGSFRMHAHAAGGRFPKATVVFQPPESWLPPLPERFDTIVDHVCRRMLGRPSVPSQLAAASQATETAASAMIAPGSGFVLHRVPTLLLAVLDTPQHMTR